MSWTIPVKKHRNDDYIISIFVCDGAKKGSSPNAKTGSGNYPRNPHCSNITKKWIAKMKANKGVVDRQKYVDIDGEIIFTNGENYKDVERKIEISYSEKDVEVKKAEEYAIDNLYKETQTNIIICPKIIHPERHQMADLLLEINKVRYDIKTPNKKEKEYKNNPFVTEIEDKEKQSHNFIFNIMESRISKEKAKEWAMNLYENYRTKDFINIAVVMINGKIEMVYKRKSGGNTERGKTSTPK